MSDTARLKPLWWRVRLANGKVMVGDDGVQTRRSAPPVADQCAKCRAAKAEQKKERGT